MIDMFGTEKVRINVCYAFCS